MAAQGQPGGEGGGRGRLADTPFAGSEHNYFACQKDLLFPSADDDPNSAFRAPLPSGNATMMSVNFA
jgi:hypothetical protein